MDVSLYDFSCQKSLHQALMHARSLGHGVLEVEHVALALLRSHSLKNFPPFLEEALQNHLEGWPRFGVQEEIAFGKRLDLALDDVEKNSSQKPIPSSELWEALKKQSTFLLTALAKNSTKEESSQEEKEPNPDKEEAWAKALSAYTVDLTAKAARRDTDPILGREKETLRVIEILGRKKKNNPILIGEPGVGKTAVVEGLAMAIAQGKVLARLRTCRVLSLDLGLLTAGTRYRGDFEERLKNLVKAVEDSQGQVILFIDEIHMLVGAGSSDGSPGDAANMLKPALARGLLKCIGATTLDEYRKYLEKDAALARRFQPILVHEPTREETLGILRGLKGRYEVYHGVKIHDQALMEAVDLSLRYLPDRRLPDKAIDVIDDACSHLRLQIDSVPEPLRLIQSKKSALEVESHLLREDPTAKTALSMVEFRLKETQEQEAILSEVWKNHQKDLETLRQLQAQEEDLESLLNSSQMQGHWDLAIKLQKEEIPANKEGIKQAQGRLLERQNEHNWLHQEVGPREVARTVALWSGIPLEEIKKKDADHWLHLEERLGQKIFGQKHALQVLSKAIRRAKTGLTDPHRPWGIFLFLGPSGVGKTETAKILAEELFQSRTESLVRIDMSEYMDAHQTSRLLGAAPGLIGHEEGGQLTEPIRRRPHSIVLLDEIEKAHKSVLDLFLQLFDDGHLTDSQGRKVDFRHTLVIMTSNLCRDLHEPGDDVLRQKLAEHLRPEFIGRIDECVLFKPLGSSYLKQLLDLLLETLNKRLAPRGVHLSLGSVLSQSLLTNSLLSPMGGRALRRLFQNQITDTLATHFMKNPDFQGAWIMELDLLQKKISLKKDRESQLYLNP